MSVNFICLCMIIGNYIEHKGGNGLHCSAGDNDLIYCFTVCPFSACSDNDMSIRLSASISAIMFFIVSLILLFYLVIG